jgi:hypothetical protein
VADHALQDAPGWLKLRDLNAAPFGAPTMITRRILLSLAALLALPVLASAQDVPDLAGRKIVIAVENAYFPLQFNDPKDQPGGRLGV